MGMIGNADERRCELNGRKWDAVSLTSALCIIQIFRQAMAVDRVDRRLTWAMKATLPDS